jgi:hypothetical protein
VAHHDPRLTVTRKGTPSIGLLLFTAQRASA